MSKEIAVRLVSPAGRSRISISATATFGELQEEVSKRTGVAAGEQRFSLDPGGSQAVSGPSGTPISQLGIVNGTQLHLTNKEASIAAQVLTKVPVPVEPEAPISKDGAAGTGSGSASSSSAAAASGGGASSSSSNSAPAVGPDGKKAPPKFETFDAFLRNRRYDTASLPGSQKFVTGRVQKGGQIKIPPAVSIKQQPYRHIDTFSVINVEEVQNFIGYWHSVLLENAMQRSGWIYGYYLEDKNYDEGTRVIVEGIYEPPQEMIGEFARPLPDDPNLARVDKIAEALGLERVGWIFTTLPLEDDTLLSPEEVCHIAKLQNEHSTDCHFTKYTLSKFVSCAVRPDASMGGNPGINPFMVSEQACAMIRDGIMTSHPSDNRAVLVREAEKNELIPDFCVEGKPNKKILTDFFVVRVNDTAPKKHQRMFTHAEFPRENRQTHPQRREDIKKYFSRIAKSEPSWSKFADFHLLIYIAQEIDELTAIEIAKCVRDREEVPDGVTFLINQLIEQ
eukprot:TRINITY_DN22066_c0_g1_i1.p1 TRINITY_DN22066_c0_g1~~TRINITY_DN22066_c0_g1_i1.p1  ORF type:complete len:507 (+),score=106.69 TRINITY_DN22066_c0_g1_i1:127-1647(+)